jgi:hypothetical protein
MPEQFPYPTDGWSTGKMRKKGDKYIPGDRDIIEGARALGEQNPLIKSITEQHQERMKVQGIPEQMKQYLPRSGVGQAEVRELEGIRKEKTQHLSQNGQLPSEDWNKYWQSGAWEVIGKTRKVDPSKASPDGVILEHSHPQIDELKEKGWESFDIPDEGWSKKGIFMKPPAKSPEVA